MTPDPAAPGRATATLYIICILGRTPPVLRHTDAEIRGRRPGPRKRY